MPRNFSLVDLIPEPDTFTDLDGSAYDVRSSRDFSASELARITRLQKRIGLSAETLSDDEQDAALEAAAETIDQSVSAMFQIVIPGIPAARNAAIPFGHKMGFLRWWQEQQPKPEGDVPNAAPSATPA